MTGADAIALISARIGNRTGATIQAQMLLELRAAQTRLEHSGELPWFLKTLDTSKSTAANVRTVAGQAGMLREADSGLFITDSSGNVTEVFKKDYRVLRTNNSDFVDNALPQFYDLLNGSFYFFPIPNAVLPLEYWYYAADTTINNDGTTNKWLTNTPDLVIAEAMIPVARFLRDQDLVQLALNDMKSEMARLIMANTAYDEANRSRYLGEAQ